jgi:hypothetical protein
MTKLKSVSRKVYSNDKGFNLLCHEITSSVDYHARCGVSYKIALVKKVGMFIEDAMLLKSLGIVDD